VRGPPTRRLARLVGLHEPRAPRAADGQRLRKQFAEARKRLSAAQGDFDTGGAAWASWRIEAIDDDLGPQELLPSLLGRTARHIQVNETRGYWRLLARGRIVGLRLPP
jgi:hypothetical protein